MKSNHETVQRDASTPTGKTRSGEMQSGKVRLGATGLRRYAMPVLAVAFCALLLWVFQRLSRSVDYHVVVHNLRALSLNLCIEALFATAISYVALVARDAVGLRFIRVKLPASLLWIGATAGSALGNATGFGALTGGAVRCRVYGAAGVTPLQVGRLSVFTSVSLALSLALMTSVGVMFRARVLSPMLGVDATTLNLGAGAVLIMLLALFLWSGSAGRSVRIGRFSLHVPQRQVLLAQLVFAGFDVAAAALALWVLLPHTSVGFATFLAVYSAALLFGMIGHTPGGLGVFEAAMMYAFNGSVAAPDMLAALLVYRAIYFGAPLVLSAALLAGFEGRALTGRFSRSGWRVSPLVPMFLSAVTFMVGGMLVVSGATPAFRNRLALLEAIVPLWVIESSQLLASMLGVLLLFVARGLFRRLDAAWWLALVLAIANLVLSLAKGLAFVEVGMLGVLIVLLLASRPSFDRSASLFGERFTATWLVSVGIVLSLACWMLFFAFRDVPYSRDLWWEFAFDERAPRALRATLGAAVLSAILAVWQLLRPAAGRFTKPCLADLVAASNIIRSQERSDAVLAMMGDKSFLFSESRRAFLMYAKRGRTWAALHDPVGPRDEWPSLIRDFVALAHSHGGRAAFYQVRAEALPLYLDAGLHLMKLGEEALLPLSDFELNGSHRTNLRYALKRGERDGLEVRAVSNSEVASVLPALRHISDAWLDSRDAREKSFSVAAFTPDYLVTQAVMLLSQQGRPVAFVTFMTTDLNTEATIGVMRHVGDASPYAMEFLFTKLALHLKQQGYRHLSLGMAPLSGLYATPLASNWTRLGALVWRFGGRFYNFKGLRGFKSKFQPTWEPRYLAASGSVGVFFTLADLSLLSAGWRS